MRDVAALAAVSLKTVSRVVNREDGVSAELRARVEEAVRLIGYRPNLTASSPRRSDRKTQAIGLLLEDVANPFSSALHRAVEDVAAARSCLVFAGSSDEDAAKEGELLRAFAHRRVDGPILIQAGGNVSGLADERRQGRPIVFVDRRAPMHDADSVTVDNRGGRCAGGAPPGGLRPPAHRVPRRPGLDLDATERYQGFVDGLLEAQTPLVPKHLCAATCMASSPPSTDPRASPRPQAADRDPRRAELDHDRRDSRPPGARPSAGGGPDRVRRLHARRSPRRRPSPCSRRSRPSWPGRRRAALRPPRGRGRRAGHVVVPTRLVERGSGEIRPG